MENYYLTITFTTSRGGGGVNASDTSDTSKFKVLNVDLLSHLLKFGDKLNRILCGLTSSFGMQRNDFTQAMQAYLLQWNYMIRIFY